MPTQQHQLEINHEEDLLRDMTPEQFFDHLMDKARGFVLTQKVDFDGGNVEISWNFTYELAAKRVWRLLKLRGAEVSLNKTIVTFKISGYQMDFKSA